MIINISIKELKELIQILSSTNEIKPDSSKSSIESMPTESEGTFQPLMLVNHKKEHRKVGRPKKEVNQEKFWKNNPPKGNQNEMAK